MGQQEVFRSYYQSPIGWLELVSTETHIVVVRFVDTSGQAPAESPAVLATCVQQLSEYFAGQRATFTVPLNPPGTPFQQQVWRKLVEIPFGATSTYGHIAAELGNPNASRAVGHANGRNPIAIILPCHRLVGSNGSLTGYGGGLWRKAWLLEHEQGAEEQGRGGEGEQRSRGAGERGSRGAQGF
jgi:methylated-DNA-[protein]-cysteine S-methyltransferase